MLESLALAVVKSLAAFLFKAYVAVQPDVKIDGAPHWYMQNVSSAVCVYDAEPGGLEAVDKAKDQTAVKMQAELARIINTVIYNNYNDLKDPKEKAFVKSFGSDPDSAVFVKGYMTYPNIVYTKKQHMAYVQGCIDKNTIIGYQTKRADKIRTALTQMRADNAFDELDKSDSEVK